MRPVSTSHDLCICYYGTNNGEETITKIHNIWAKTFNISNLIYHMDYSTPDLYHNLWRCAMKKRQHDLTERISFKTVLVINTDSPSVTEYLTDFKLFHLIIDPAELLDTKDDVLYYCMGEFLPNNTTAIDTSIFYSNNVIFDMVANFGLVVDSLRIKRNNTNDFSNFFYYLKTLKIKAKCVNYENRGLFKRST